MLDRWLTLSDEFLVITAQQLHTQCDALMPLPGNDSNIAAVKWRLKYIPLMGVVVSVALKKLQININLQLLYVPKVNSV